MAQQSLFSVPPEEQRELRTRPVRLLCPESLRQALDSVCDEAGVSINDVVIRSLKLLIEEGRLRAIADESRRHQKAPPSRGRFGRLGRPPKEPHAA